MTDSREPRPGEGTPRSRGNCVRAVEVLVHGHATEDMSRLRDALAAAFGIPTAGWQQQELTGHWGSTITQLRLHVTGLAATEVAQRVLTRLPGMDARRLLTELPQHMDEHGGVYLRLDKQALVQGRWALDGEDVVRVRIRTRGFKGAGWAEGWLREQLRRTEGR